MDEASIAKISQAVVSDTQFWIGLIGIIGAFVGSALTFFGTVVLHWIKARPQRDFDNQRIEILKEMLEDARFTDKWRKLSTLAAVIGASEQETKRL